MEIQKAKEIINTKFPDLYIQKIRKFGEGMDTFTFEVNEDYVFRFPKHEEGASNLLSEINYLPNITKLGFDIEIPIPLYISKEYPLYAHKKITGSCVGTMDLSDKERINLAKSFATFLKTLHKAPKEEVQSWGLEVAGDERINPQYCLNNIEASVKKLSSYIDINILKELLHFARNFPLNLKSTDRCLIHGDLYPRHIILNSNKNLYGIIDWGDLDLANPAIDLQIVYMLFPTEGQNQFFASYGNISYEVMMFAKLRAVQCILYMMSHGYEINDKTWINEAFWSVNNWNKGVGHD